MEKAADGHEIRQSVFLGLRIANCTLICGYPEEGAREKQQSL
jgi:hypothetical protein